MRRVFQLRIGTPRTIPSRRPSRFRTPARRNVWFFDHHIISPAFSPSYLFVSWSGFHPISTPFPSFVLQLFFPLSFSFGIPTRDRRDRQTLCGPLDRLSQRIKKGYFWCDWVELLVKLLLLLSCCFDCYYYSTTGTL
ncbi:hypothetical protein ASPWEDRAFT_656478 [Aspergillus wentii DTO 134E9]|uniref:Uncharacterized protein n=1 Tax=Aspergillus wentii DTO 134E9 TaxID=1073089 RepID=A0A1L9RBG6_ASPWE|nr:uncharacterized protein ASPWEDRAFT_656478 [Aspergillus wentii DTO 134E9]OJJ32265.1 hypothetical protein ASPWEDRAFT_656478 [Aspergillus wentii DTO 134E9]